MDAYRWTRKGTTYEATKEDGGRFWRITDSGARMSINAAIAPDAVLEILRLAERVKELEGERDATRRANRFFAKTLSDDLASMTRLHKRNRQLATDLAAAVRTGEELGAERDRLRELLHDEERRQEERWEERTRVLRAELEGWRMQTEAVLTLVAKREGFLPRIYSLTAEDAEKLDSPDLPAPTFETTWRAVEPGMTHLPMQAADGVLEIAELTGRLCWRLKSHHIPPGEPA